MEGILAITFSLGMPVAIVFLVFYFNSLNRKRVLNVVGEAARAGQVLTPEVIRALGMNTGKESQNRDMRTGCVLLAIAGSLVVVGWALETGINAGTFNFFNTGIAVASFPGFIGIVLLIFGWLEAQKQKKLSSET